MAPSPPYIGSIMEKILAENYTDGTSLYAYYNFQ